MANPSAPPVRLPPTTAGDLPAFSRGDTATTRQEKETTPASRHWLAPRFPTRCRNLRQLHRPGCSRLQRPKKKNRQQQHAETRLPHEPAGNVNGIRRKRPHPARHHCDAPPKAALRHQKHWNAGQRRTQRVKRKNHQRRISAINAEYSKHSRQQIRIDGGSSKRSARFPSTSDCRSRAPRPTSARCAQFQNRTIDDRGSRSTYLYTEIRPPLSARPAPST